MIFDLFFHFFKLLGAYAAERALVVFRQLIAFVDVIANGANKLFHNEYLTFLLINLGAGSPAKGFGFLNKNVSYLWLKYNTEFYICQ